MSTKKTLSISIGILLIAAVVTYLIFTTEPTAESEGAIRQSAMLVDVVEAERGDFEPVIVATGTVEAVEDVMLSAQVAGQVIRRFPGFTPGGFVQEGNILLQIDPSDYRNSLELRKSELLQTESDLEMEMGRQEVAQQDLELAGVDSLSMQERSLVLRQPQLNSVRATIKAARAAVDQAELDLARTTIRAPFDAHILDQNVSVGSQVNPGDDLGRLVGSEHYRVVLTVPVGKLRWLRFDSDPEKRSRARIRNTTAWQPDVFREGYLYKQVGALDDQTRLARVLVRVPDPLLRQEPDPDKPELMIGTFVEAEIQGNTIREVVRLDRDYIRNGQTVWVMTNGKLSIRKVDIVLTDNQFAYVREGLGDKEKIVTTNLSTVSKGVSLRTKETDSVSVNRNENGQVPQE